MAGRRSSEKRTIIIEPPRRLVKRKDGSFKIPAWRLEELASESARIDALTDATKVRTLDDNEASNDIILSHAV